jgi:hypothetical protein
MRAQHTSTKNVYHCYAAVYRQLSTVSTILYIRAILSSIYSNTPSDPSYIQDVFSNTMSFPINTKSMRFFSGTNTAGLNIAPLSKHPIISATSLDVIFTAISLLGWAYICDPDVEALLESSTFYYAVPSQKEQTASDDMGVQEIIHQQGHSVFTDPNMTRAPVSVTQGRLPAPTASGTTGTRTSGTTETKTMTRTRPRNRYVAPSTSASQGMVSPHQNMNSTASAHGSIPSSSSAGSNSTSSSTRAMPPPLLPPRLRSSQPAVSALVTRSAAAAANAVTAGNPTIGAAVNATTNAANPPAANPPAANPPAASAPTATGPPATPARRGRGRGAPPTRRSARVRDYKTKNGLTRSVDSEDDLHSDLNSDSDSESGPSSDSSSGLSPASGQSSGSSDSSGSSSSSSDVRSIPRPASASNGIDDLTYARAGDAVALALFSMLTGGLGALGAAVLGAETMG